MVEVSLAWEKSQDLTVLFPTDMVGEKDQILFTGDEAAAESYEMGFWGGRWAIRAQDLKRTPEEADPFYLQGWEFGQGVEKEKWGDLFLPDTEEPIDTP
jgi:hypothetical protein